MHTVVVVDSDPRELALLSEMLQNDDYAIETAATGAEAKALLDRLKDGATAVVLDWTLPDIEGLELLQWIKSKPFAKDVEVIVHSEDFVPVNVEKAIGCGAYYFLTKPFDEPQLEAIVRAAAASAEQKRELERLSRETRDAVRLLKTGSFRLKTLEQAELLAVHLASACGHADLSLGLRELLVNAVEHGNLGISYDEKGRLVDDGRFLEECRRRLSLPEHRNKHVRVDLTREPETLTITIKDEGEGFDFEKFKTLDEERLFHSHGRGVLVASSTLDLEYVAPGNQVKIRLPTDNPPGSSC